MIRITGPIDQTIMDEKIRLIKKSRKIDSVAPIGKVENYSRNNDKNNKDNNSNESEQFAKVLEKNKKRFDEKA